MARSLDLLATTLIFGLATTSGACALVLGLEEPKDRIGSGGSSASSGTGGAAPSCSDSIKNGDETDVDCGGSCDEKCADGRGCADGADCVDKVCDPISKTCAAPLCGDKAQNGDETDVDCGGTCVNKCPTGQRCVLPGDCKSGMCVAGICAPGCTDTVKNQDETDIDCGGVICAKCAPNKSCMAGSDCVSGVCSGNPLKCQVPTCMDGVKNSLESDVDCGNVCPNACIVGKACALAIDCASKICTNKVCQVGVNCHNTMKDGDETGIDCGGGACDPCGPGLACKVASDCIHGVCTGSVCLPPTCMDGVQNGDETDVDCGGMCSTKCAKSKGCAGDADCLSNSCYLNKCQ